MHTFPGLQSPDIPLLQAMEVLMPDFVWSRTTDDWDAPMLLGFSDETSVRLDSRQRLWFVTSQMDMDDTHARLMEALAELTHRQFLKGFTEDHRSLVGALNSLHWGLATAGTRGLAADEVMTTVRHGQSWLSLYTRRAADKQAALLGWAQVPWPTVEELLAAEPELAGVIINPFEKINVQIPRQQCLAIGGLGCALLLQQDISWGIGGPPPSPVAEQRTGQLVVRSGGAARSFSGRRPRLVRTRAGRLRKQSGHHAGNCGARGDGCRRRDGADNYRGEARVLFTGRTGDAVGAVRCRLRLCGVYPQQISGMAVRVLALNDESPDGLQKGIASEGVTKLNLIQSTSGRCLVMNVPVAIGLKSRLLLWLKPYQKYMLQVGG